MPPVSFTLNGKPRRVEASPETLLITVLRELLGLTGTKLGCGQGACGSCTVLVDGQAVRSCATPLSAVRGKRVVTIEGLAEAGWSRLQEAWVAEDVSQCGYCQPGMLMAAAALLGRTPRPTDPDIDAAMGDMLCRCGTYNRIRRAIHRAAQGGRP